jgi:K+-sensing histidine kinase KdpD
MGLLPFQEKMMRGVEAGKRYVIMIPRHHPQVACDVAEAMRQIMHGNLYQRRQMTMMETQDTEHEEPDTNPFGDLPGEAATPEDFYGYITRTTEGDFAKARRMIDYYMRRLQALEQEMEALTESVDAQIATHEAEIEAMKDLRGTLVAEHEEEYKRITWLLEGAWQDFQQPIKTILGRSKTWKLTNGSISSKVQQPLLEYDEEAAVAFIEALPDLELQGRLLNYSASLRRSEMKDLIEITPSGAVVWKNTGEVLSFAVAEIRDEKITIKPRPPAAQEGQ